MRSTEAGRFFFQPLDLHLEPADLLVKLGLDRLALVVVATAAVIITQILGDAHKEAARLEDPIDLLFIDSDKQGYLDYLTKLLPLVRPGGLIVAHNMASPPPDPAFVKAITTNPELETLLVNMESMGLGITLKKR